MELPLAELTCITGRTLTSPLKGDLAGLGDPLQLTEQGELSVSEAPGLICSGSQALAALDTYKCGTCRHTALLGQGRMLAAQRPPPLVFGCKRTSLLCIHAPHLLLGAKGHACRT